MQNGEKGYPAYKVSDNVTSHLGMGMGIYCNFNNLVQLENAIKSPANVAMHHLVTVWLSGAAGSSINHIINGTGPAVTDNQAHMVSSSPA
jgi:hypothetical protein